MFLNLIKLISQSTYYTSLPQLFDLPPIVSALTYTLFVISTLSFVCTIYLILQSTRITDIPLFHIFFIIQFKSIYLFFLIYFKMNLPCFTHLSIYLLYQSTSFYLCTLSFVHTIYLILQSTRFTNIPCFRYLPHHPSYLLNQSTFFLDLLQNEPMCLVSLIYLIYQSTCYNNLPYFIHLPCLPCVPCTSFYGLPFLPMYLVFPIYLIIQSTW